jgi:hypothetical protein
VLEQALEVIGSVGLRLAGVPYNLWNLVVGECAVDCAFAVLNMKVGQVLYVLCKAALPLAWWK